MQERRPRADQKEGGETRRQRQPRAAQEGNHEGRQAWETSSLGDGSGSQEQPRREITKGDIPGYMGYKAAAKSSPEEIMKGDKLGTQRSSGGQEQPRMEMKRAKQTGTSSKQQISANQQHHRNRNRMQQKQEEQPRREFKKGDKLGSQGGSGNQEQPTGEIIYAGAATKSRPEGRWGDKAAAAAKSSPGGKS